MTWRAISARPKEQGTDAPGASGLQPTAERSLVGAVAMALTGAPTPPLAAHLVQSDLDTTSPRFLLVANLAVATAEPPSVGPATWCSRGSG
jgi:hypothetical protein